MSMIKYRVHEVAKDFNVTSKVISQILTDYIAPPKNHMQVLENNELDVIFEYMTQHNQVASLEEVFNVKHHIGEQHRHQNAQLVGGHHNAGGTILQHFIVAQPAAAGGKPRQADE